MIDTCSAHELARVLKPAWQSLVGTTFSWSGQARNEGTKFEAIFRVVNEGRTVKPSENGFQIEKADAVTIIVTVETDYRGKNAGADAKKDLAALGKAPYDATRAKHVEDYGKLFNYVDIDLGTTETAQMRNNIEQYDDLSSVGKEDRDSAIFALYFQYRRHLLIASPVPGTCQRVCKGSGTTALCHHGNGAFIDIGHPMELKYLGAERQAELDVRNVAGLQNLTQQLTFRLVAWGGGKSATLSIGGLEGDDLIINGKVMRKE